MADLTGEPSKRLKEGAAALLDLSQRVEGLEAERDDAERMLGDREQEVEGLQRELEGVDDATPLRDALADVRRGVRTLDELYEDFEID